MTKSLATTPLDPSNPMGFGAKRCSACGGTPATVGPLAESGVAKGYCQHCAHELKLGDILAAEARDLLRDWYAARQYRYPVDQLGEAVDEALDGLRDEHYRQTRGNAA